MKAAGYVRVSTTQQDLQRQINLINEFCDKNSYTLTKIISDKASGADLTRTGLAELLTLTNVDVLIMTEISRLSRQDDIMETLTIINAIIKKHISIILLDNGNYQKIEGTLDLVKLITLAVKLKGAADERKNIVQRMLTGRRDKFTHFNNMCIGRVPFGYSKVENPNYQMHITPKSFLVRNEDAYKVEQIYKWVINGEPIKTIAKRLSLGESTVCHILHNPIYKGIWSFSGRTLQGDSIIDPSTWESAQEALKTNRLRDIIRGVNFNPLKGILKCPCGHSLYIIRNGTKASPNNRQYRCASNRDTTGCGNGGCNADVTIKALWYLVCASRTSKEFNENTSIEALKIQREIDSIDNTQIQITISNKEKELNTVAHRLATCENDNLYQIMYEDYLKLNDTIKALKEDIVNNDNKKAHLTKLLADLQNKTIYNWDATEEEMASVFQRLLKQVTCYSENKMRSFLLVEFKNGAQFTILLVKKVFYCLPFQFNPATRKVIVELKEQTTGFSLNTYFKEYNSYELESTFDLSEYKTPQP
jgi:site-specific DNA recombinase